MEKQIRLLRADEIECRTASVSEKGLSILLYKDARVDQRILDETFGMFGWQHTHQCINGSLYCIVEVYDQESGRWVAKQDVGTIGNYEKEKSQASDSFKRACFNWGIGRELYSAPFIWVPPKDADIRRKDGKFYCSDRFCVASISYNENREIISLRIVNDSKNGKVVFELHSKTGVLEPCKSGRVQEQNSLEPRKSGGTEEKQRTGKQERGISDQQLHILETELQRTGVGMDAVRGRYGFGQAQDMSKEMYSRVMKALAKTKSVNDVA